MAGQTPSNRSHTTETIIPLYHLSIQLNQLSHPEGESSMFLQILEHLTIQGTETQRPSSDINIYGLGGC